MSLLDNLLILRSVFESAVHIHVRDAGLVWMVIGLLTVLYNGRLEVRTLRRERGLMFKLCLVLGVGLVVTQYGQGYLVQAHPNWWWHPFMHLWGWKAVETDELAPALRGVCVEQGGSMCLSDRAWATLSGGALSPQRSEDVGAVGAGVRLAHGSSLVVAALARDIFDSVPHFRKNVEALVPFFKSVEAVIFENDSNDGTREALLQWAASASGYQVRCSSRRSPQP